MPPRTANCPRSSTRSTRSYPALASAWARPSRPGSSPITSRTDRGRAAGRRHPLGQSGSRCADEPAGGEDVEGAGALADEMRRRLEPRCVRDAAAREQRHAVGAEEPRRALGRVPRVRVLGEKDQQPSPELLVQRGEHERQRGLRHARPTGQRLRERLEPVAGGELRDEGVKGCRVHANSGNRAPRGYRSALLGRVPPPRRAPTGAPTSVQRPRGARRCPEVTCERRVHASAVPTSCQAAVHRSSVVDDVPRGVATDLASPAEPRSLTRASVEATLRLFETDRDERLDSVGRATDDRGCVLLGRERGQHEVGDVAGIPPPGPTDAHAQAEEVGAAEPPRDRAEAVVPGETAAEAGLEPAELEVDLVVDDEQASREVSCRTPRQAAPSGRSRSCTCPA